jgi:hypothetical protein
VNFHLELLEENVDKFQEKASIGVGVSDPIFVRKQELTNTVKRLLDLVRYLNATSLRSLS